MPTYRSRTTTSGRNMAGARVLWRATGMTDDDFDKPIVAVANSFTQFVPGHVHLKDLGQLVGLEIGVDDVRGHRCSPPGCTVAGRTAQDQSSMRLSMIVSTTSIEWTACGGSAVRVPVTPRADVGRCTVDSPSRYGDDVDGDFARRVGDVLGRLRPGEVATYGEVAEEAGFPGRARAVGRLLAEDGARYPWWRVVTATGRLVPGHEAEHARRLGAEGVATDGRRVVRRRA